MSDLISKDSVLGIIESKCVDGCLEAGGVTLIDAYGLIDEISDLPNFDNEKLNEREVRDKVIEECEEFCSGCAENCPHEKREQAPRRWLESEH